MLRIISGQFRGVKLASPPNAVTRPTMDRVREAVFNILIHRQWGHDAQLLHNAYVLDAFAGSGALGLESLSHGAKQAYFFDNDQSALKTVRQNIAALGVQESCKTFNTSAFKPPQAPQPMSLIFLDPPFGNGMVGRAIKALSINGWINDDTVIVAEMEANTPLQLSEDWQIMYHKKYGNIQISFIMKNHIHTEN